MKILIFYARTNTRISEYFKLFDAFVNINFDCFIIFFPKSKLNFLHKWFKYKQLVLSWPIWFM